MDLRERINGWIFAFGERRPVASSFELQAYLILADVGAELAASLQREQELQKRANFLDAESQHYCTRATDAEARCASLEQERLQYLTRESDFADAIVNHWFIQGGKAEFGELGTVSNADEIVSAILLQIREQVASLEGALRTQTERACSFNCDAESGCNCPAHNTYREGFRVD